MLDSLEASLASLETPSSRQASALRYADVAVVEEDGGETDEDEGIAAEGVGRRATYGVVEHRLETIEVDVDATGDSVGSTSGSAARCYPRIRS